MAQQVATGGLTAVEGFAICHCDAPILSIPIALLRSACESLGISLMFFLSNNHARAFLANSNYPVFHIFMTALNSLNPDTVTFRKQTGCVSANVV